MSKKKSKRPPAAPPLRYEFVLSDGEFARAWLAGWMKRPGQRMRALLAPLITALGVVAIQGATDTGSRLLATVTVGFGAWLAVTPFLRLVMRLLVRRRTGVGKRPIRVEVGAAGVSFADGSGVRDVPWASVVAAGREADHVWLEMRGGNRAAIPMRAIPDPAALDARLREHVGPLIEEK